jgi:hypothetical protein
MIWFAGSGVGYAIATLELPRICGTLEAYFRTDEGVVDSAFCSAAVQKAVALCWRSPLPVRVDKATEAITAGISPIVR